MKKIKLNLQVKYVVYTIQPVEIVHPNLGHFSSQGWLTMAMTMVPGS